MSYSHTPIKRHGRGFKFRLLDPNGSHVSTCYWKKNDLIDDAKTYASHLVASQNKRIGGKLDWHGLQAVYGKHQLKKGNQQENDDGAT